MDLKPHYPVTHTFTLHGSIGKIAALIKSFPTVPNMTSFGKILFGAFGQYDIITADLGMALDVFETSSTYFTSVQNFRLPAQNEQSGHFITLSSSTIWCSWFSSRSKSLIKLSTWFNGVSSFYHLSI